MMEIEPVEPDEGLVEITAEEAARLTLIHGTMMILHRDGRMYRVLDPWDRGDVATS